MPEGVSLVTKSHQTLTYKTREAVEIKYTFVEFLREKNLNEEKKANAVEGTFLFFVLTLLVTGCLWQNKETVFPTCNPYTYMY